MATTSGHRRGPQGLRLVRLIAAKDRAAGEPSYSSETPWGAPRNTSVEHIGLSFLRTLCGLRRPKPNTVKLGLLDEVVRWMPGLWPVGVVGAFDVPLGHLAFDHTRCRPRASGGVESSEQSAQEDEPAGAVACVLVRGKNRPGGRESVW